MSCHAITIFITVPNINLLFRSKNYIRNYWFTLWVNFEIVVDALLLVLYIELLVAFPVLNLLLLSVLRILDVT